MRSILMLSIGAFLTLAAGSALAAYPNDCSDGGEPGGDYCTYIEFEGCCDEKGRLVYCEDDTLYCIDCDKEGEAECGWSGAYYDCGTKGSEDPGGDFPKWCLNEVVCDPPCGEGQECVDGQCTGCQPDCQGKQCGPDGCDGSCGTCPDGTTCSGGTCGQAGDQDGCLAWDQKGCGGCPCEACVCQQDPYCCQTAWDNLCVSLCETQCGGCGEVSNCGDGACDLEGGENCGSCADDCNCSDGQICYAYQCCTPDCEDKVCGDDGCGGSCGDCPGGQACIGGACGQTDGCLPAEAPGCGGCACQTCVCEMDEFCCEVEWDSLCVAHCEADCGGCGFVGDCGNSWCDSGENCANCAQDCACPTGDTCYKADCCSPDCAGKICGSDGCGGTCGECPEGAFCQEGSCKMGVCEPDCSGKECGDDGCGGGCGECKPGFDCKGNSCQKKPCLPECDGKICGGDGCGGTCGECPAGTFCDKGVCQAGQCEPDCEGKQCGDDGCGQVCGACPDGEECKNHKCIVALTCHNECHAGDHGCEGNSRWVCVAGPDGCLVKKLTDCGFASCVQGACIGGRPQGDVLQQPDTGTPTEDRPGSGEDTGSDDGCSMSRTPGNSWGLLLLAFLALVVLRRRSDSFKTGKRLRPRSLASRLYYHDG